MEQLRTVLAWMSKHHFWLLSGLAVLLSFAVWYLAASDLKDRKGENLETIKNAFGQQEQLARSAPMPSEDVITNQQSQIVLLTEETKAIWQELYDRQRQDVLKWPPQLPPAFLREIEDKQFGDEVGPLKRDQYGDYIRGRFADLPKLIDANEIEEDSATGGAYGGRGGFSGGFEGGRGGGARGFAGGSSDAIEYDEDGNPIEPDFTVYWSEDDQGRIQADLDWPKRQSHWRIWVTQEDLWVYETMLRAIAETNKKRGATRYSNAAVSEIHALQVGRDAAKESRTKGRIKRLQGASSLMSGEAMYDESAGGPAGEDAFEGDMDMSGRSGGLDGGDDVQLNPAEEKARWLSRRYIDDQGQPIQVPPDDLPLDPAAFGQEMKRLPVRLAVKMDERWLSTLISELANADLQIKVTEVRVGVDPESTGGGGEYGGGRGGFSGGSRGGEFGGGFGGGANSTEIQVFNRKPYMKDVVIQGVVLIFNSPNDAILNGGEGELPADPSLALN
ncbi:hypothetical protein [Aeoliella sp.]|uniref:hypothetical protein n=1 Tax=Aeoliella sp. TaxID=2795800 RepID=UPI003CCB7F53